MPAAAREGAFCLALHCACKRRLSVGERNLTQAKPIPKSLLGLSEHSGGKQHSSRSSPNFKNIMAHRSVPRCALNLQFCDDAPFSSGFFAVSRTLGYAGESELISRSSGVLDRQRTKKHREMKNLDRRFSVAPMMDWTDIAKSDVYSEA